MASVILDPAESKKLIAQRRATGADRYDEVWEGVYVMAPMANNEHQELVGGITSVLHIAVQFPGLGKVLPGTNVTDREDDWTQNYRCPDVVAFLNDTKAKSRHTHWLGGPDFAVEIISEYDRSREKFDFYATVGTRELLIVDRYPWALELYRLEGNTLALAGVSTVDQPRVLASQVVPLSWQLVAGKDRPAIRVAHTDGKQAWTI